MTIEELLEEAAKRYPPGTKYRDVNDSTIYTAETKPQVWGREQIHVGDGLGLVYSHGNWAEIVGYIGPKPETYPLW